ncbi:hypothetical protein C1645_830388, partial [Glomus cerebriforme]
MTNIEIAYKIDGYIRPKSGSGSNTMYCRSKSAAYFLFDFATTSNWYIHTNTTRGFEKCNNSSPYTVISGTKHPNLKFKISKCLTFFFQHQDYIPSRIKRKYFLRLRTLLLNQHAAMTQRFNLESSSNKRTNTFIRFSYKGYISYFGFFHKCSRDPCQLPCNYVLSNHRSFCHLHKKEEIFTPPPPPRPVCPSPLLSNDSSKDFHVFHNVNRNKIIHCKRMNTYYIKQVWFDLLSNKVQTYSSQLWWQVLNKKQQKRVLRFTNTSYYRSRHYNPRDCMHTVTINSRLSLASFTPISLSRLKKQVYIDPSLPGAIGISLSQYKRHMSRNVSSLELLKRLANHNHSPDYFLGYAHEGLDTELDISSYNEYLQQLYLRSCAPPPLQSMDFKREYLRADLNNFILSTDGQTQYPLPPSNINNLDRSDLCLFYTRKRIQAKSFIELRKFLDQILWPDNPNPTQKISWNDIKSHYHSLDPTFQPFQP